MKVTRQLLSKIKIAVKKLNRQQEIIQTKLAVFVNLTTTGLAKRVFCSD